MSGTRKVIFLCIAAIFLIGLVIIYGKLNPANSHLFPKCPFKTLTGYQCPGCGSQRAVHYLLNFNVDSAIQSNRLLVYSIPYVLLLFLVELFKSKSKFVMRLYKILFSTKAIWSLFAIIVFWWFVRNL